MNKTLALLIVTTLLGAPNLFARELTLSEALAMAKDHSFQLKASKAQTDAFEQSLKAASTQRLPSLSLTSMASYKNESPQMDLPVPGGLSISVSPKETYQTDVRLTLPLFTGGKIGGGVDLARSTRDYYLALENATENEIVLAARVEFLSLYRADRLVDAAEAGLARARVIEKDVQSLFDAGAADSVNILDARMAVTNASFQLESATSARRQSEISLGVLLGLEPREQVSIAEELPSPPTSGVTPLDIAETKPELVAAASSIGMSQSLVSLSRADYFPSLSAFGGYSWGKPNIDPFNDEFNDYFVIGASLSWSFHLGGKTMKDVSRARHQLQTARYQYDRTREQIGRQAQITLENLKLVHSQYRTALENLRIASDNYRLAGEKHRQGVLSANRLLEIEAALTEAESSLASSQAQFYIVQSQYYFATGSEKIMEGI